MADHLVKEDGGRILLESGSGSVLLEVQSAPSTGDYLVHEVDGVSRFTLEDGSGFILLEQASPVITPTGVQGGIIIPRRRLVKRLQRYGLEEDEAIALSLLLRTRKRLH